MKIIRQEISTGRLAQDGDNRRFVAWGLGIGWVSRMLFWFSWYNMHCIGKCSRRISGLGVILFPQRADHVPYDIISICIGHGKLAS